MWLSVTNLNNSQNTTRTVQLFTEKLETKYSANKTEQKVKHLSSNYNNCRLMNVSKFNRYTNKL